MEWRLKVTLIGFESGSSRNSCAYNIASGLSSKRHLQKIVCIGAKGNIEIDSEFLVKEPFFLKILSFLLSKIRQNILKRFPDRYYNEQVLFDSFAQAHIDGKNVRLVLHTDSGLVRCLEKAKERGAATVILHRTLHPEYIYDILMVESEKWGIWEDSVLAYEKWVANRVRTLRLCDRILALSELEKDNLCRYRIPGSKIEVIHHGQGVDMDHFVPLSNKNEEPFTVLFLGHKSLIKGVPYLLQAWRKLNLKNSQLIVAGHQDKKLIEMYRSKVQFQAPGPVDPLKYYHKAHIFVLPSLGDPFPRTVLEAMSCGLPVIVSDMVGSKDIIEHGKEGFIVPTRNIDALADKIRYFYENPTVTKVMGRNAQKKAKEYTWEKFAEEVVRKMLESN